MLNIIGIGLNDEKDITVKGLELVKESDYIYLENYTSKLQVPITNLEKLYNKKIILVEREFVEDGKEIIEKSKSQNVSLLIIGDPFSATTHLSLLQQAKDIKTNIIGNASVLTAIGIVGLELYKYGKTTSIPFHNEQVQTPYDVIKSNKPLHTLCLLDLSPKDNKFMEAKQAIDFLLNIEKERKENVLTEDTKIIVCSQLGSENPIIQYTGAKNITNLNKFPQCLIIPGDLHFMEEEFLNKFII
ncbi:diphthine synthase [archaeon]|nr:diphthine synthase [archaeon]